MNGWGWPPDQVEHFLGSLDKGDQPAYLFRCRGCVTHLFDRRAVVAWLLAHDKIEVPTGPTVASLVPTGAGGAAHRFRLDDPWLALADDAAGEDSLSGWSTEADADALAGLAAGEFGASVRRLTAPGTEALAVLGEVRVIDRFRSGVGRPAGDVGRVPECSANLSRRYRVIKHRTATSPASTSAPQ